MRSKRKSFPRTSGQRGNAMVYVLIVVALFGALSFVLARQTDTSETGVISSEQAEIYASMIQQAAAQLKQSVEQMTFTGTTINPPELPTVDTTSINLITPDDNDFEDPDPRVADGAPAHAHKLFHPHGGGAILPRLPDEAINEISDDPPARWYIGRFNNVEWTPSDAEDIILTAHQINKTVCELLNLKLAGDDTIPVLTDPVRELLIDHEVTEFTATSNIEFTSARCAECYGQPSLCVQDDGVNAFSFYSIIAAE